MWKLLEKDDVIQKGDQRFEPNNIVKHWVMILKKFTGEKYDYHKHGIVRRKISQLRERNDSLALAIRALYDFNGQQNRPITVDEIAAVGRALS